MHSDLPSSGDRGNCSRRRRPTAGAVPLPLPARSPRADPLLACAGPPPGDGGPATPPLLNSTALIAWPSRNWSSLTPQGSRNGRSSACAGPAAAPSADPAPTAAWLLAANHCFHPVLSSSRVSFTLCSAVIWSNFLVHSSSVTGRFALARTVCACLTLKDGYFQKNKVNKGKKSAVYQVSSLEIISILLESVTDPMTVTDLMIHNLSDM